MKGVREERKEGGKEVKHDKKGKGRKEGSGNENRHQALDIYIRRQGTLKSFYLPHKLSSPLLSSQKQPLNLKVKKTKDLSDDLPHPRTETAY